MTARAATSADPLQLSNCNRNRTRLYSYFSRHCICSPFFVRCPASTLSSPAIFISRAFFTIALMLLLRRSLNSAGAQRTRSETAETNRHHLQYDH